MKAFYTKTMVSLLGAAMVSTALVGCGGSSSSTPPSTSVNVSGGISAGTVTNNTTVDASTAPVVSTLSDGTDLTFVGGSFAPGEQVTTISAGSTLFNNFFADDGRATLSLYINVGTPLFPGDIGSFKVADLVNAAQGASLLKGIALKRNKAYTATVSGKSLFKSGNASLHISTAIVVYFFVDSTGKVSFPSASAGQLPVDGGTTFSNGQSFSATTAFANTPFRLLIAKTNGAVKKTVSSNGAGTATFTDNGNGGNNNPAIPTTGVQVVELDYFQTPFTSVWEM